MAVVCSANPAGSFELLRNTESKKQVVKKTRADTKACWMRADVEKLQGLIPIMSHKWKLLEQILSPHLFVSMQKWTLSLEANWQNKPKLIQ